MRLTSSVSTSDSSLVNRINTAANRQHLTIRQPYHWGEADTHFYS
jgi:hypothetical protein